ncbi:unnamed protein product [marine sediment metagenome]|uniref:YkgJ family cysteine cluster protein n=1 Tax=marine sediment metagenome TaxID=412755 RepID=X0VRD0_9ZZZZ
MVGNQTVSHAEDLCVKCGRCCHMRISIRGEVFVLPWSRCQHFDDKTNLCAVYKDRFKVRPECLTVEQGIKQRAYPRGCPYVQHLPGYRPPIQVKSVEQALAYVHWW